MTDKKINLNLTDSDLFLIWNNLDMYTSVLNMKILQKENDSDLLEQKKQNLRIIDLIENQFPHLKNWKYEPVLDHLNRIEKEYAEEWKRSQNQ
jgi:hypothetical protein